MCLHPAELTLNFQKLETRDDREFYRNLQEVGHISRLQHKIWNANCDDNIRGDIIVAELQVVNRGFVVSSEKYQDRCGNDKLPTLLHREILKIFS